MVEASFGLCLGLSSLCGSSLGEWASNVFYLKLFQSWKQYSLALYIFFILKEISHVLFIWEHSYWKNLKWGKISNIYKVNTIFFKYAIAWEHLSKVFFGFLHPFSINRVCHTPEAICVPRVKLLQGLLFPLTAYIPQMDSITLIFLS